MAELNRKSVRDFKESEKMPLVVVLDDVRSLNNVGSAFRTSDAFLVEKIYLCGYTGTPPHRDIQKTALGATETVQWTYMKQTTDAVAELQEKGYRVLAVEQAQGSMLLNEFEPGDSPIALVFGNEVAGVSEAVMKMVDGCIEIPQLGMKHSLNISVSIGIVLWDVVCKMLTVGES